MATTVTISSVSQLLADEGSGSKGDVKVVYTFSAADGDWDTSLEYKTSDSNWMTVYDVAGTIGADTASTTSAITAYWLDPDIYGSVESDDTVQVKIIATRG